MDYKAIINLMKEMNHTELTKLEIEEEGIRICLEKTVNVVEAGPAYMPNMIPSTPALNPVATMPVNTAPQTVEAVSQTLPKNDEASCAKIVSPMVGTFYSSSSPDKPVFVKVGDKVKKGQTVCIIEAMKLMNEIESDQDGEIVKIMVSNEQMVEFGQPLFLVK